MNTNLAMGIGALAGIAGGTVIGTSAFQGLEKSNAKKADIALGVGAILVTSGTALAGMDMATRIGKSSPMANAVVGASLAVVPAMIMGGGALSDWI